MKFTLDKDITYEQAVGRMFEMLGNSVVGQYAADRNAAGQTFRRRYDIGANADLFIGEERARTCAS